MLNVNGGNFVVIGYGRNKKYKLNDFIELNNGRKI